MGATTASVHIQVPHGRNPPLQDPVNTATDDHRILENHLPGGFMVRGLKHQQATTTRLSKTIHQVAAADSSTITAELIHPAPVFPQIRDHLVVGEPKGFGLDEPGHDGLREVDSFYLTDSAPVIVNPGREEQGLLSE